MSLTSKNHKNNFYKKIDEDLFWVTIAKLGRGIIKNGGNHFH
jgi:hypothetical protein